MKLSMHIFADWLKDYQPECNIKSNLFEIEAVRLFAPDVVMEKNTLYIGYFSDLFQNSSNRIICTHNNDLILLNTSDLESVLNCILDAFSWYNAWDHQIMNLLTSGGMLQDLFDNAIINCPIFLLDPSQRLLAYTKKYPIGTVDELWDTLIHSGSCSVDFLIKFNQSDPDRLSRHGLYTYTDAPFPNDAWHYNFFHRNHFLGSATMIIHDHDISQGELDLFYIFCQYIEKWFMIHIQEQHSLILDNHLKTAITDEHADISELYRRLLLKQWQSSDELILFRFDAPFLPYNINLHLCHTLNMLFSKNCIAITSDLSICMICNISCLPLNRIKEQLQPLLENSRYYATISFTFTLDTLENHNPFYTQYQYVSLISSFTPKEPGMIYDGNNYTLPYLLSQMTKTVVPEILHPAIKQLKEYDQIHHTDFYQTLYIYIKNGRSLIDTLSEMHLHRNTLLYRLKRLEELIQLDLNDANTRLHLWISFEIDLRQKKEQRMC